MPHAIPSDPTQTGSVGRCSAKVLRKGEQTCKEEKRADWLHISHLALANCVALLSLLTCLCRAFHRSNRLQETNNPSHSLFCYKRCLKAITMTWCISLMVASRSIEKVWAHTGGPGGSCSQQLAQKPGWRQPKGGWAGFAPL